MVEQLNKLTKFDGRPGPLLFVIMDGIGLGEPGDHNAVHVAKTPTLDMLLASELQRPLWAHGPAVGLPSERDTGNSEVGHNIMGAGRIHDQGSKLVTSSIQTGGFFKSELWHSIEEQCIIGKGTLHFIGLLSDGNAHSHLEHLFSIMLYCAANGFVRLRVHALLDGRDAGERTAPKYIESTELLMHRINQEYEEEYYDYKIASGGGRMTTTMDRYNASWEVVKRGWYAHVLGEGRTFESAKEAVLFDYAEHPYMTDQDIEPFVVIEHDQPIGKVLDGDCVINFNFRGDRAMEISRAFDEEDFNEFERKYVPDMIYAGMMLYDGDAGIPKKYLVGPPEITGTLNEYLCKSHLNQFAVAETKKYEHVSFFWNGNRSGYIDQKYERFFEIPSETRDYAGSPAMKASEVTAKTIELLRSGDYRFGRVNFANGDMVGHTGNMEATVAAVETVDASIGELLTVIKELNGLAIITADHGNADEMIAQERERKVAKTAHSRNPVPFVIYDPLYRNEYKLIELKGGGLSNIASTILNLLGYEKAANFEPSLIEFV